MSICLVGKDKVGLQIWQVAKLKIEIFWMRKSDFKYFFARRQKSKR